MTLGPTSGGGEIAEHALRGARKLRASNEAIMRAALSQMPMPDGMALLDKLRTEWMQRHQEIVQNTPIGSRRDA